MRTGKALLRSRDATEDALETAAVLGQLRGVATKLGQMAGYVDGIVPLQHRATYERAMAKLQNAAPKSDPVQVRALLEEELGASRDQLFAHWEEEPVASASLGQVHRARLPDGREVAVKIQHPGIAEAMEADLRNTGFLQTAAGWMGGAKIGSDQIFEELRQRFREELDYRLEAERQQRFRRFHAEDAFVHVPAVHPEHSSRRVLTTDFVEGLDFVAACEAGESDRRAWVETLWRFVYGSILFDGVFNADPHPGNYFFHPGGKVTFLDFGCVSPATAGQEKHAIDLHWAANLGDRPAFHAALLPTLGVGEGAYAAMVEAYVWEFFRPIRESPFRIDRTFTTGLVDAFKQTAREFRRLEPEQARSVMPEGMLFMNRLQFGFNSVLARLDVEVDYRSVERRLLERFAPRP
jgi:predicted unusual protein kinase regulating ubiquinone biosynthesis (AarF/ABC1/UbiB family)